MEAPSAIEGQEMEVEISAMGYADDTYGLGTSLRSLQGALEQTQLWLCVTGQDVNGKKSVAFTTEKESSTVDLIISGASILRRRSSDVWGWASGHTAVQKRDPC